MDFSKLNKRVELKAKTVSQDAVGEEIETWTGDAYATIWAEIQPLNGRELETAQQVHPQVDYKITIRYHPQVTAEHRVYWRSRIFEITAIINPSERGVMQVLYCKEIPYISPLPALAAYCVAHWKMNDNADTKVVLDSSGNEYNGTSVRNTSAMHVDGKTGTGALNFNGTTDYIDCNDTFESLFQNSFSVKLWCKPYDGQKSNHQQLFGCANLIEGKLYSVQIKIIADLMEEGKIEVDYSDGSNNGQLYSDEIIFSNGVQPWTMLTAVFTKLTDSAMRMELFVNDTKTDSGDKSAAMGDYANTENPLVGALDGCGSPSWFFQGPIDNLMLFNKALTQADVTALYNKGYGTENFL